MARSQGNEQNGPPNDGDFDPIGVIVAALRSRFGDDALAVAQQQADTASPESAPQWAAIVSRL